MEFHSIEVFVKVNYVEKKNKKISAFHLSSNPVQITSALITSETNTSSNRH